MAGCGATPKKPESKVADQRRKAVDQKMVRDQIFSKYPVEKIKLVFAKKSEIRPPAQKGNLPDFRLDQWEPKRLDFKGKLAKKWTIKAEKSKSVIDYMYFMSMPDGWIIRPNREKVPDIFDKIIDPGDCSVVRNVGKYVWQGMICGKYLLHTTANRGLPPLECTDMTNWSTGWISGIEAMTADQNVMVADGCLIVGIFVAGRFDVQRINHRTGEVIWEINSITGVDFCYHYVTFSAGGSVFVLGEYLYDDSNFVRLILIKINPHDGSYKCKDIYSYFQDHPENDYYWYHNNWAVYNDKILLHCGNRHLLTIDPKTMIVEKDNILHIPAMSEMILVGDNLVCIDYLNGSKGNWAYELNNTGNKIKLGENIAIFNDQMMVTRSNEIQQIIDTKMTVGWYIDLKEIDAKPEDAFVCLQDWRGILVVTDKEIICFGKP